MLPSPRPGFNGKFVSQSHAMTGLSSADVIKRFNFAMVSVIRHGGRNRPLRNPWMTKILIETALCAWLWELRCIPC